jgi:geranyl-CoA carboxylase alpha subunit
MTAPPVPFAPQASQPPRRSLPFTPRPFDRLLVANRGEIACRVMRTAQRLGLSTVAVYSDADADAPHVQQADAAVRIGPPPAADSYLNAEAILAAARASGAEAVHPGYGFLSERADFAQAVLDAGLVWVGPPPAAIEAMGSKAAAKRRMLAAGVPCVPGYLGEAGGGDGGDERLQHEAEALGVPLLVKAVAGGGGRGMRLVHTLAELPAALASARREALAAFGDGTLMLERLVREGRHIEVQVFFDAHGAGLHLGERDCTAQRRRQKVIEEAPSPIVTPAMREALGRDALAAARAVGYVGAGTVEFIVNAEGAHHFLEMNTRLQVEHAVTEAVTGLDLVEWQLRIAMGEPLPLAPHEVRFEGHAIEVRLYAEDPAAGFAPQTGTVRHFRPEAAVAAGAASVRIDAGVREGQVITPHYDAMVAKLVAHGRTRADAVRRLRAALAATPLLGVANNGAFLHALLAHPRFTAATMHTALLDEWAAAPASPAAAPLFAPGPPPAEAWELAAALIAAGTAATAFRPASVARRELRLEAAGERRTLRVPGEAVHVLGQAGHDVRWHDAQGVQRRATAVLVPGAAGDAALHTVHLALDARVHTFHEPSPWLQQATASDPRFARATVAGTVVQLPAAPGQRVPAGAPLACIEAMKMELWLHAAAAGTVRSVHAALRESVAAGALIVELELDPAPPREPGAPPE